MLIVTLALTLLIGATVSRADDLPPPTTVNYVDLDRYAGLWHEIAHIPNRFQKQCVGGTTAEYRVRDDGRIDVINRCRKDNGKIDQAKGVARVVDGISNAKLEVSFFSILGIRPFWGDYWIMDLGPDYEYAVIGTPNRKYGWILAREDSLPVETMHHIYNILREQGYNPDDFELTPK